MDSHHGSVMRRTERDIERLAKAVRSELGVAPGARISVQPILEHLIEDMVEGAYFQVEADSDLGGAEARTDWHQPVITVSWSTYSRLLKGEARPRMTIAHEIGHLLMHTKQPVYHYRMKSRDRHVDPEWQADYFAAALLMPPEAFRKMRTVKQAMKTFGVSRGAALRRARIIGAVIVDDLARTPKKKGHGVNRAP